MSPGVRLRYEESLASMDALVAEIKTRLTETGDPERTYEELRDFMLELRAAGREEQEDMVLDAMDLLTGWTSPENRLVPKDKSVRR